MRFCKRCGALTPSEAGFCQVCVVVATSQSGMMARRSRVGLEWWEKTLIAAALTCATLRVALMFL